MSVSISDSGIVFNDGSLQPTALTTGTQTIAGAKTFSGAATFSSSVSAASLTVNGNDISSVGIGQTWQNVAGSRTTGTDYTNSTGRPIQVSVTVTSSSAGGSGNATFLVSGVTVAYYVAGAASYSQMTAVVPAGATYRVNVTSYAIGFWAELR